MTVIRNSHQKPDHRAKEISSAGFTLIETLIAILVFAISLMGGIAVYFNAAKISGLAIHKKMAIEVVNARVEELRAMDYDTVKNGTYPINQNPGFEWAPSANLRTDVSIDSTKCPVTDHRVVKVEVSWDDPGFSDSRKVAVETCFAP